MLVLTLKQSFVQALTISAIARLLTYAATCAALPVLRRTNAPPALFRLRGGTVISILSLMLAGWLLANSTLREAVTAAIAALVGLIIFLAYRLARTSRNPGRGSAA
jgi:amino acid transporter